MTEITHSLPGERGTLSSCRPFFSAGWLVLGESIGMVQWLACLLVRLAILPRKAR